MANAAILTDGNVIQTTKLDGLKYNLDGFLIEFKFSGTNNIYKSVEKKEFRPSDIANNADKILAGYYLKDDFLKYLAIRGDFNLLKRFNPLEYSILATNEDLVRVERLSIVSPYTFFYKIEVYKFFKHTPVLDSKNFQIIIPSGTNPTIASVNDHSAEAAAFYNNRITLVNSFPSGEKDQAARLITQIGLVISMINTDIFPLFLGYEGVAEFVLHQNNEWISGNILNDPTLEVLSQFYDDLFGYYKNTYSNQLKILLAVGYEKVYWLGLALSIAALSVLPVNDKLELLIYLVKNKLGSTFEQVDDEELVIKLCLSFNETNIDEIDSFLAGLIEKRPDAGSSKTLYELIYSKMSTSTHFKAGLLGLTNWVFNTKFAPTRTKDHFVRAVYFLWQFSKYNPFDDNGDIKPHTISFKNTGSNLVSFTPNPTDNEALFNYTHYVAYEQSTSPPYNSFRVKHSDAAPLLMPYGSEKLLAIFFANFTFELQDTKILAYEILALPMQPSPIHETAETTTKALFGTYDIFQPVTLLNNNVETVSAISTVNGTDTVINGEHINSFIPLFVLHYIGDAADKDNAQAILGYIVDVATTFAGVGALEDLRVLIWASAGADTAGLAAINISKVIFGGIEFSTGVTGLFLNLVECGPDDTFCKNIKTFVAILQLGFLGVTLFNATVSAADSLMSLAMKKQAAKVIEAAGGLDEIAIKQNIRNKLESLNSTANADDLDGATNAIYQSGHLYSFSAAIASVIINTIKRIIKSKGSKFALNSEYTDAVISSIIKHCDYLNLEQKEIEDLIVFANRKAKYVPPDQLTLRASYYAMEIKKRGFTAGFDGLTLSDAPKNYQSFCNAFKNKFLENMSELHEDIANNFSNAEYVVKGSAAITWKSGDPDVTGTTRPSVQADDFDGGVRLTRVDYIAVSNKLKESIKNLRAQGDITESVKNTLITNIDRNFGKIQYNEVFSDIPIGNSNFAKSIQDACSNFTRFDADKIGFAIILKGGNYDNLPEFNFKF